jgi:hypothetical protein
MLAQFRWLYFHPMKSASFATIFALLSLSCAGRLAPQPQGFDVVIRGGTVYDGSGTQGRRADVAI